MSSKALVLQRLAKYILVNDIENFRNNLGTSLKVHSMSKALYSTKMAIQKIFSNPTLNHDAMFMLEGSAYLKPYTTSTADRSDKLETTLDQTSPSPYSSINKTFKK